MIFFPIVAAFFIFVYHYLRNGIPWNVVGTTGSRAIWAAAFVIGYVVLSLPNTNPVTVGLFLVLQFLAQYVPHAAFQNMGRWATPQKNWAGFWLPTKTDAQWTAMTPAGRTRHDFYGMLSVGIVRAIIVYIVAFGVMTAAGLGGTLLAIPSACVVALSQPFAYLLAIYVPFKVWSTPAHTDGWGEIFVAIGWAISLAFYSGFSFF